MSDPRPVSDSLAHVSRVREALHSASISDVPPVDDELDAETLELLRQRGVRDMRAQQWHLRCPQRFHRAQLDDIDAAVRADIDAWLSMSPRPNLVLLGAVGVGKTHAALAAARADHERGLEVVFLPVVELLDLLRPGGPEHALDDVMHCDRLVVDDLGHERSTDWTWERLGAVVNRRWLEERPIIATSNLDPPELSAAVGERTYSRLVGDGAVVIHVAGDDRRRKRADMKGAR